MAETKELTVKVSLTDTEIFKDILQLLKELAEKDATILDRFDKIMEGHGYSSS
mgnify:CR=1 FL=1